MQAWMTVWTILLIFSGVTFVGLLVIVGGGAIRELRQSLDELREDARQAAEHPETLDQAI